MTQSSVGFVLAVACILLVATDRSCAQTNSDLPTFTFVDLTSPLVDNTLTVNIGANVSLQCSYTNQNWGVTIIRYQPVLPEFLNTSRKFTPIVTDRAYDRYFAALKNQFDEFGSRLTSSFNPATFAVTFKISNFQYEDAGDFGCFAADANTAAKTQIANLTIKVKDQVVFTDLVGNEQNFMNIAQSQTVQLDVNCTLFHVHGLADAEKFGWFETCSLFDSRGAKLAQPVCSNERVAGKLVGKSNFVDPIRYGEFWPRRFESSTIQATFPITQGFYNKSIGCFGRRNDDVIRSDFMTIVKEGTDLNLDPASFACSSHQASEALGKTVSFSCTVSVPTYRQASLYWEILEPPTKAGGQWNVKSCNPINSCRITNVEFLEVTSKAESLYTTALTARLQIRLDSNNSKNRYRLAAHYSTATTFRSANFTITVTGSSVQPGKGGKGSGSLLTSAPFLIVSAFAAVLLSLTKNF